VINGTLCSYRFTLTSNLTEMGALMGWLDRTKAWQNYLLRGLYNRLAEIKRQIEKQDGVKKTLLPNGLIRVVDIDGTTITRPPLFWELKEFAELRKIKGGG
jgi:hypothetical protein